MNKQIKLYIKQHKTGLQYFGKTSTKDINKYKGSGLRWKRHIKKHGYDVVTFSVGSYDENDPMLIEHALGFSACNDIVNSNDWANLKPENGIDGGCYFPNEETKIKMSESKKGKNNHMYGVVRTVEERLKISNSLKGRKQSKETKDKISKSNKGKIQTDETRKKISLANSNPSNETREKKSKAKIGKNNPNYGKVTSYETKNKISKMKKGKKPNKIVCPKCSKEGSISLMKRWHGEFGEKCTLSTLN